jgi:hypothetical protein
MSKWNVTAMGQVGLSGLTSKLARRIAPAISRKTGRPEAQVLAMIGAGFLVVSLVDFLRTVDAVVSAGRSRPPVPRPSVPS